MSGIHYFQRYSQKENVATNNTLLLFSRLYNESPLKFEVFFSDLLDDTDFSAGIQFSQQNRSANGASIPDGFIEQSSFKIVVETKLYDSYTAGQLISHLDAFDGEDYQVLLALGPHPLPPEQEKEVLDHIKQHKKGVRLVNTTFAELIHKFQSMLVDFELELNYLISDYEEFCGESGLIPHDHLLMRAVGCGKTYEENFELDLYYDKRGFSPHKFIGMYSNKCIIGIGELDNIIQANLEDHQLIINNSTSEVTAEHRDRILVAMSAAYDNNGWDISKDHYFFCVQRFYRTEYKKTTLYPLQGTKFFNLKEVLDVDQLPEAKQIAELLKHETW